MSDNHDFKIAVIGLGAQGLVAVKNLLEEGFEVTGFDKNEYVGGIWHYSAEDRVSVMPTTVVNGSKERSCFTDFPYPDDCDSYPSAKVVDEYLNNYCDHFQFRAHLKLGHTIKAIKRDDASDTWIIEVSSKDGQSQYTFNKLVIATGPHNIPIKPRIQDENKFKGSIVHSVAFKDPSQLEGLRVMVVGASNTAADTSTLLVGKASKVYFAHRNGCFVVPRYVKGGQVLDHGMNYRMFQAMELGRRYVPNIVDKFMDIMVNGITREEFGLSDPAWRLTPAPSTQHQVPTISDTLIPALRAGAVTSTAVPKRIVGDHDVELEDGHIIRVDAIILCTGYDHDFSILGKYDPTLTSTGRDDCYTPRLYQNILSLDCPNSLAFIGTALVFLPAFLTTDLSTMALAQLWSVRPTSPSMPSKREMDDWHAQHVQWMTSLRAAHPAGKAIKFSVSGGLWMDWVQRTAGTNVEENLGWTSWQAWKFWWKDPTFYKLLMDGLYTSVFYRLFDSDRRRTWSGARDTIQRMNEQAKKDVEKRKATMTDEQKEFIGGR